MQRIHVHELPRHTGERVSVDGWLQQQRRLSRLTFLLLRDRTGIVQVIVETPELMTEVGALHPESVLELEGSVVAAEQAPGGVELHDPSLRVLSPAAPTPPIDLRLPVLKEQLPTQLDHAPVALRHPRKRATFELAAASIAGFRAALDGLGFTRSRPRRSSAPRPRVARTCSPSTTSAVARTSRRVRSSSSK